MRRKIFLHGYLSSFHQGPIEIVGETVAEVIECLTRQLPGFKPHPVHGRHRVKVVGYETRESLYQPLGDTIELHIVPQLNGGKRGGLMQILLGAVLIGVGFFLGASTFFGSMLMKVGAMALLGGLAQLLAPQPDSDSDKEEKSKYLGSPKNTVQIGTRIPIVYGEYRVYGHYISFDINAVEFKSNASSSGGSSGSSK